MNEKLILTYKSTLRIFQQALRTIADKDTDVRDAAYLDWMLTNAYDTELFEEVFDSNLDALLKRFSKSKLDQAFNFFLSQFASKKDVLQHQIQLSLLRRQRTDHMLKSSAYPMFLWVMGSIVLTFLYIYLIPNTYRILDLELDWTFYVMQFAVGLKWGLLVLVLIVLLIIHKNYTRAYLWNRENHPLGIWARWESLNYVRYLLSAIHLGIPFQTFVTFHPTINTVFSLINERLETELKQGHLTYTSLALLDPQLSRLLSKLKVKEAFIQELNLHARYLEQRLHKDINQMLRVFKVLVYLQTSVLVFSLYQLSLSPLKLMEVWS